MQRLEPYLGTIIAFLIAVFVLAYVTTTPAPEPRTPTPTATSTIAVVPGSTVPALTLSGLESTTTMPPAPAPSTHATSTPKKVSPPPAKNSTAPAATSTPPATNAITTVSVPASLALSGSIGLDASASNLRNALVNIICYVPAGSGLHSISGSGVVIDSKGIILTNAHIAQYFLLADWGADCTIRAGSPAANKYDAALIYISPAWLRKNSTTLTQATPSGTGEYDFALLAITKSATNTALPASFPAVPFAIAPPTIGTPIVIATYGAQFLEANQIQSALFPTVVFGSVKDLFTFHTNTVDVLALGGSVAAQEGSSGGGVADVNGELVGTITTSTITGATATRSLSAITASYVRAEYASEMGRALDLLLAQSTPFSVAEFAPKIPMLEAIITAQLR